MLIWKEDYRNCIRTAEQLCNTMGYPETDIPKYQRIIERYPMQITPYYLSLIDRDDPSDPIARMCIPTEEELSSHGSEDTSGEIDNTMEEGVQHKYEQTALILSTNVCAMYCRHCFRKRMVGLTDSELVKRLSLAVEYVKNHKEINNVLISGGDSLMNSTPIIERYLSEFTAIESLDLIRFGSRVPVTFPQRITEDPELLELFEIYGKRKQIYVVTQFNHPRELTEESERCIKALAERGIRLMNQTVLMKGVNDDPEVLAKLLSGLTATGVLPYYIFQCRPVRGVKGRFQVPILEGSRIVDEARSRQNGLGKSVTYAMSHPMGKIEIVSESKDGTMVFKFHQSKYPENRSRVFMERLDVSDTWLDDNLKGIS